MSEDSIQDMLEAEGSFPEEAVVRRNFQTLFALAQTQQESELDLASGFLLALDQWAHVAGELDADVAQALRDWARSHWALSPYPLCEALCVLLANTATPDTLAFLQEQFTAADDADIKQLLGDIMADISRHQATKP